MRSNLYRVTVTATRVFNAPPLKSIERTLAASPEEARGNIAARYWNAYRFHIDALDLEITHAL